MNTTRTVREWRLSQQLGLVIVLCCAAGAWSPAAAQQDNVLRITANFTGEQAVAPDATLELHATRPPSSSEGHFAVFVGDMDITALCLIRDGLVTYTPRGILLPLGQTSVIVYLVTDSNAWTEIARLPILVAEPQKPGVATSGTGTQPTTPVTPPPENSSGPKAFQFVPSVSVNIKGQSTVLFFPSTSRPDRVNFTDIAFQASFQGNYTGPDLTVQNQFDLAGSSVQNEALRFGDLGNKAMQVDLASYLMRYQFHRSTLSVGQVSFGTNRELVNSFSSRGISLTVPINKRLDFSAAIMNGTSVVGFNNFFGLDRTVHQILGGTIGLEVVPQRPGGLRLEVTGLNGSLLPLSGFNQQAVTDAQRSRGASVRVLASDPAQRFHLDAGFARSRFTNPADPLLYQGRNVIAVVPVSRNARYLDVSYDLLRDYTLSKKNHVNLNLAYHHERVDPLYRSVAAFSQADRLNNQWDLSGSVGSVTAAFDYTRSNDNLAGIPSILRTLNRRTAFNVSIPTANIFSDPTKPSPWFPRLSYTIDNVHQFAPVVPVNGDFASPAQIPDQVSRNQSFVAEWQVASLLRLGYRFNLSFQDNRQLGRERADLLNVVNGVTVGLNPLRSLDVTFDLGNERASNFEQNTINSTLRVGTNINWRMTQTMAWALNAATTGAGDRAGTNHSRNIDFDIQYSWRLLSTERTRFRKVQAQFFIRYANRYASSEDLLFRLFNINKLQTVNAGLNFIFF
jgi:hypothetical protein